MKSKTMLRKIISFLLILILTTSPVTVKAGADLILMPGDSGTLQCNVVKTGIQYNWSILEGSNVVSIMGSGQNCQVTALEEGRAGIRCYVTYQFYDIVLKRYITHSEWYSYSVAVSKGDSSFEDQQAVAEKGTKLDLNKVTMQTDWHCGLLAVSLNDKWGFMNSKGKVVIPLKYDSVLNFGDNSEVGMGFIGKTVHVWNKKGTLLYAQNDVITSRTVIGDSCAVIRYKDPISHLGYSVAYIGKNGSVDNSNPIIDDRQQFYKLDNNAIRHYGYKNSKGQIAIPAKYLSAGDFCDGVASVYIKGGKDGSYAAIIDENGNVLLRVPDDASYTCYGFEPAGCGRVWATGESTGYGNLEYCIDYKGNVISKGYLYPKKFYNNLAIVQNEQKLSGVLDTDGVLKIPCQYQSLVDLGESIFFAPSSSGSGTLINASTGKEFNKKYDTASSFYQGIALVSKNGKYGYINKAGKEVIPLKYSFLTEFEGSIAYGRINSTSKITKIQHPLIKK